jgi:hypothetical protein
LRQFVREAWPAWIVLIVTGYFMAMLMPWWVASPASLILGLASSRYRVRLRLYVVALKTGWHNDRERS